MIDEGQGVRVEKAVGNNTDTVRFELTTFGKVLIFKISAINQTRPSILIKG